MCPETLGPLTGEMIRAARALTRLSRQELATAAGVGLDTIKRLEEFRGTVRANAETLARITAAFRAKGVSLRHDADCSEVSSSTRPRLGKAVRPNSSPAARARCTA